MCQEFVKALLIYFQKKNCVRLSRSLPTKDRDLQDIEIAPVRGGKRNWPSNSESNKREILIVKDN